MTIDSRIWQGVLAGLAFGAVNFWLLIRIVRGMVESQKIKPWKTFLSFAVKIALLALTIGLLLKKGYVSPLPFIAGFTVSLVLGVAVIALKTSKNSPENP
ncbi:MAG TPA: ATP synthase subunit I [bacterium]|nr:ATP synthase subunit I [bacterium]